MVNPPNLPLRAGSSGPFVDWAYWLRNLYKNVQVRRVFEDYRTGALAVLPPGMPATPGTEVAAVDIEYDAADAAIAGQLSYVMFGRLSFQSTGGLNAYPGPLYGIFDWEVAGGSPSVMKTDSTYPIPTNPGVDFDFHADLQTQRVKSATQNGVGLQGTNRIILAASNPAGGPQSVECSQAHLIVVELASPPSSIIQTP